MSKQTDIQWCDSTVNPIMGCGGCELFPSPGEILPMLDAAIREHAPSWKDGTAKTVFKSQIAAAFDAIAEPDPGHRNTVTTTNLWHFRESFVSAVRETAGPDAAEAARGTLAREVTCYAAKLHLNKGASLLNPDRRVNEGYAATFEQLRQYPARVAEAARWSDLKGTTDSDRPWIDGLPRLIFVSDMGDAFSRRSDFDFLRKEVIAPVTDEHGRRHLWLWLTKRPALMAEFSAELEGGLPKNICAMTTVTGPDGLARIDQLRKVKAAVRGLSVEPLWERIDPRTLDLKGIDWVIVGGESGSKVGDTRPFPIEWAKELRDHCRKSGVAFFLKQLGRRPTLVGEPVGLPDKHGGEWDEWPDESLRVREFPRYFHDYRKREDGGSGPRRKPSRPIDGTLEKPDALTPDDRKDFARLDKVVGRFARDMIHAAEALYEIRSRRLYRVSHATFEDYCQQVHEMSRNYANRLILAGRIRAEMVPIVTKMGLPEPSNEAQLRELARLKTTEAQVAAYREAAAHGTGADGTITVTAKLLADVIAKKREPDAGDANPQPRPTPAQRIARAQGLIDELESRFKNDEGVRQALAELRALLEG